MFSCVASGFVKKKRECVRYSLYVVIKRVSRSFIE
jgi:hypothetical protein